MVNGSYILFKTSFKAASKKEMKKAIITGAKISIQPMPPVIIFMEKRITLNNKPNKIKTS